MFLGKELSDEQLANVVKYSTFDNMREIPQASYKQVPVNLLNHHQGRFMRKGKNVYCGSSLQEISLVKITIPNDDYYQQHYLTE